jgi:hypothetical protein
MFTPFESFNPLTFSPFIKTSHYFLKKTLPDYIPGSRGSNKLPRRCNKILVHTSGGGITLYLDMDVLRLPLSV